MGGYTVVPLVEVYSGLYVFMSLTDVIGKSLYVDAQCVYVNGWSLNPNVLEKEIIELN